MLTRSRSMLLLGALLLVGCDGDDSPFGPIDRERPANLDARYEWVLDGWNRDTGRPVGHPSVTVSWDLPAAWNGEPFRVYARRAGQGFRLIATTTSCENGECRYVDTNVVGGTRYEYFVSTVDERDGFEVPSDYRVAVDVAAFTPPPAPGADTAFGLDDAIFLRWRDGGSGDDFWKYQVYLTQIDGAPVETIYQAGETDGTGFLDLRARNGHSYGYRVAALDVDGHVSDLSPVITGVPRPDFNGELIYAYGDSTQASGFRFAGSDDVQTVVSGDAPNAQWRLEVVNGTWQIRPLGETEVLDAGLTTALTCAPTPDPGCRAVFQAPTSGYTRSPVAVNPEFTYVFRVRGDDGRIHYGVIRAEILGSSGGNRLMIFDWAYQLRPEDTRLLVKPG